MIGKYKIAVLLFCFLLLGQGYNHASTVKERYLEEPVKQHSFDPAAWQEIVKDFDYTTKEVKRKKEDDDDTATTNGRTRRAQSSQAPNLDPGIGGGTVSAFFKMLLIVLLIALVGYGIFKLSGGTLETQMKTTKDAAPVVSSIDIDNIEQHLEKSDMEILLDKTLAEGNYMLAVRVYYLWAIKELSTRKLIKWKRDKTNRDYIRELKKSDADLQRPFRTVTRIFERVWYGQNEISQTDYNQVKTTMDGFIQEVKKR